MPKGVYEKTGEHKRKLSKANIGKHSSPATEFKKGRLEPRGELSHNWKGGIIQDGEGYLLFMIPKGHRFFCMKNNKGQVRLHRFIMAEYLQRPLRDEEVVHHINGDITDNRRENLKLFENNGKHMSLHHKLRKIRGGKIKWLMENMKVVNIIR